MVLSVNPVGGMLRAGAGLAKDTFLVVFCKSPAEQDVDEYDEVSIISLNNETVT